MDNEAISGHYLALSKAKQGILPDGRTKVGKTVSCFTSWLKSHYGANWNPLQEARLSIAIPWLIFWAMCPMVNQDGHIMSDFMKASGHLERCVKDIASLATKDGDGKGPNLKEYIDSTYGKEDTNT